MSETKQDRAEEMRAWFRKWRDDNPTPSALNEDEAAYFAWLGGFGVATERALDRIRAKAAS